MDDGGIRDRYVVHVGRNRELRRELQIHRGVVQKQSGIDVVGLSLPGLVRSLEGGNQTEPVLEIDPGVGEWNALTAPEAETVAGKIFIVQRRVPSGGLAIVRIRIAREVEERNPVADPVFVLGKRSEEHTSEL